MWNRNDRVSPPIMTSIWIVSANFMTSLNAVRTIAIADYCFYTGDRSHGGIHINFFLRAILKTPRTIESSDPVPKRPLDSET